MRALVALIIVLSLGMFAACGSKKDNEKQVNYYYTNPNNPQYPNNTNPNNNFHCSYPAGDWNPYLLFETCLKTENFPPIYYGGHVYYNPIEFYTMVRNDFDHIPETEFDKWFCLSPYRHATYGNFGSAFCSQNGFFYGGYNHYNNYYYDTPMNNDASAGIGFNISFSF